MTSMPMQLVGGRSDKAWFLKEIEITNLNTSVTWLCEFNCWLPKNDGKDRYEVKPLVNPQAELSPEDVSGEFGMF
jgi:molybdenum cofactor biosynthesis enzyme MoaA